MGSQNVGKAVGLLLLIPVSFLVGIWVLTNPSGAISGLSKLFTIVAAFAALVNPRAGLFLLVPQVIYTDQIKRLAVSYGAVSYSTVYEVLLGPIITIMMLNAAFFVSTITGKSRLSRGWLIYYAVVLLISIVTFAAGEGKVSNRAQLVLNSGLYLTLIPLISVYLKDTESVRKFLKCIIWWALPAALWGIKQYYFGLNQLEIDYAKTGLSATHYIQVMFTDSPRPFGFFGSNSGYSCVSICAILALLYIWKSKRGKLIYLLVFVFYAWAVYASKQRTVILLIPLAFFTAWCFRSRILTKLYYGSAILVFGLAVAFSDQLLNTGLDNINRVIASNSKWGSEVLSVSTFSDRLRGWSRLKKASSYSILGTKEKSFTFNGRTDVGASNYNHDMINKILIETGVVGLLLSILIVSFSLSKVHGMIFRIRDPSARQEASVLLSTAFMVVILSLTAGSILATNPNNLIIWSIAGAFLVIASTDREKSKSMLAAVSPGVEPNPAPRRAGHPLMVQN